MAEYIDKHETYMMLKDLETAYMQIPVKEAYGTAARRIDQMEAADVQPVKQWISVKDSVPEAGVNVLVTDGIHMMVTWCEYVDNQCLWVDNFYEYVNVRFKEVTHWMPLPEPPKNGDTE